MWKVVEWAYIEEKYWKNESGKISRSEPRHRICYEYADYGDLWDLIHWYHTQRYRFCPNPCLLVGIIDRSVNSLILPESFLWHVIDSMVNALCYCCYGTNKPWAYKRGWDGIVHMDIKPENMLLATPDLETHHLYPCVKLADFGEHPTTLLLMDNDRIGLAHTIGVSVAEIRYYKSAGPSVGTQGYVYIGNTSSGSC